MKPKPVNPRRLRRLPPVEIREMRLRDLAAVFELGGRLFKADRFPTLYRSWDDVELVRLFSSDAETCFVAEAEGKIVGFALGQLMEKPKNAWRYGWLLWLGVAPRFARGGVATRLVNTLIRLFREMEVRIVLVDTDEENVGALEFFRQSGFGQEIRHTYLSLNLENTRPPG